MKKTYGKELSIPFKVCDLDSVCKNPPCGVLLMKTMCVHMVWTITNCLQRLFVVFFFAEGHPGNILVKFGKTWPVIIGAVVI